MNLQYILKHELTFPQVLLHNEQIVHDNEKDRLIKFAARLEMALLSAGIKKHGSGVFLSKLTGVTPRAASKWSNAESFPRKAHIEVLSDRLGVRPEWLEYGIGPMTPGGNVTIDSNARSRRRAPVISDVQAGYWGDCNDPLPPGVGDSWEDVPNGAGPDVFWLRVIGDSMTSYAGPSVPEGSLILVNPDISPDNGRLVVAKLTDSEEVTFKRLVIDGGRKFLKALNPAYPVIEINSNCRIVGVVTESKQKL